MIPAKPIVQVLNLHKYQEFYIKLFYPKNRCSTLLQDKCLLEYYSAKKFQHTELLSEIQGETSKKKGFSMFNKNLNKWLIRYYVISRLPKVLLFNHLKILYWVFSLTTVNVN